MLDVDEIRIKQSEPRVYVHSSLQDCRTLIIFKEFKEMCVWSE
jgi:hypothetical protein